MAEHTGLPYAPSQRPIWPMILVGIAVVLLAASVGAFFYLRDSLVPRVKEQGQITQSLDNLRQLAQLLSERSLRKGFPPYTGKRFVVSLVAYHLIDTSNTANPEIFFSPGDPDRRAEAVPHERWREVTKQALAGGLDVDDLTSYVGPAARPETAGLVPAVPLLADLHFDDVVLVAFSDGTSRRLDRKDLGLGPDDPFEVGEASKSPILRLLSE